MAIERDSETWANSEHEESLHTVILDFLKEHQNKAYSSRELCDEIHDTDFESLNEAIRLQNELSEEEYGRRAQNNDLPRLYDEDFDIDTTMNHLLSVHMTLHQLAFEGVIESRKVPTDRLNIPYDWESQTHYSIEE